MLGNEEDVKLKLVYPYLKQLGFDVSELSFEQSFTLRVGTYTIRIDTNEQIRTSQPRLDILLRRDGKNLAVIEVKSDYVEIGQDQIDQAISYARLVHPIAPFSIVTNGKDWRLFKTDTKEEVGKDDFRIDDTNYEISLPDGAYYDAVKHFFGYSSSNLLEFCHQQNELYMRQLKGSPTDRNKKYIAELYEPREDLTHRLSQFLTSDKDCFVVVGVSGGGKTCWICNTALEYTAKGFPALFYRADDVREGIFRAISNDLNWVFPTQYTEAQAIKRLLEIFQSKCVLVFVDGLDEIEQDVAIRITREFVRRTDGGAKLIGACKSDSWPDLLERDGIPTDLSSGVFKVGEKKGYALGPFTAKEYHNTIARYKRFYDVSGLFEGQAYEDARNNPFMLRMMFEVADEQGSRVIGNSTLNFFEAYYDTLKRRFGASNGQRSLVETRLCKLAERLFENNSDLVQLDHELSDAEWQSSLERLVELNILEWQNRDGLIFVGFYFKKLRDYLVAFKVYRWQDLSATTFSNMVSELERTHVRLDVLSLYYVLASPAHKRGLDSPKYENAVEYVTFYERLIDDIFHAFKDAFPPHTRDSIGLAGHINLADSSVFMYGFRPIAPDAEKVVFIPATSFFRPRNDNRAFLAGAQKLHDRSGANAFIEWNILDEVIWGELLPALEEITETGMLNESGCRALLEEFLLAACVRGYPEYFGFDRRTTTASHPPFFGPDQTDLMKSYLPLNLEEINKAVLHKRAYKILYAKRIEEKIDTGEIEVRWGESGISSHDGRLEENKESQINDEAWGMAERGVFAQTDAHHNFWDDLEHSILTCIDSLRKLGVDELQSSPILDWYDSRREAGSPNRAQIPRIVSMRPFLEGLFLTFLNEYQVLIRTNFPTLCDHFQLYGRLPLTLFVVTEQWNFEMYNPTFPEAGLDLYFCKGPETTHNSVISCSPHEIVTTPIRPGAFVAKALEYAGTTYSVLQGRNMSQSAVTHPHKDFSPFELRKWQCVLRSLVYQQVRKDLDAAFHVLALKYDVDRNSERLFWRG